MVLQRFTAAKAWKTPLVRDVILGRLMRRYAAVGSEESLAACSRLLAAAPQGSQKARMLVELDNGLKGSLGDRVPRKLRNEIAKIVSPRTSTSVRGLRLAFRCGSEESHHRMVQLATDRTVPTANRKDQAYMLTSIVDPSCFIRVEYLSVQVVTEDGRILTGLVVKETPTAITLVDSNNENIEIARDNIDEMVPSEMSQMPEDLLKPLSPQQLRNLFAYLRSDGPEKKK